ncbi:MAG: RNA methyltransferase [Spirochaetota bacterium]
MSRKMETDLQRFQVVLVEPQTSGNVGSVCRAMKTMGFTRLVIVGRTPDYFDLNQVKTLSLHAQDLFAEARFFDTLPAAVSDSILAAGITRRRGKYRKYFSLLPEQFAAHLADMGEGTVSLVFGRESDGLTDEELSHCNVAVRIPSSDEFPSLNLSHAVQVITYSLSREYRPAMHGFQAIEQNRLLELSREVTDSFDEIGFFKQNEKEEVGRFFRDIFSRSGLSESETARLIKMFRKMAKLKIHLPR